MMGLGALEAYTQKRVVDFFKNELGYRYLGDRRQHEKNANVDTELVKKYLSGVGYTREHIDRALDQLRAKTTIHRGGDKSLYQANKEVYELLRYGAKVKVSASAPHETVAFINWKNPEANDFAIAEEVTLEGDNTRRPDLVLYVNGIALGVIELKSSTVSINEGIRQILSNQQERFHRGFFSTVQYLFAGSDAEGLKYGTIETPQKYWLRWKEDVADNSELKLDKYLKKMCRKDRFLELCRDFVLFDGGVKKVPRVHQYFAVKASQEHVRRGEGGIIWHTQGSGKSLVMVFLAKWILENLPEARVLVITDRTALDQQIEGVFANANEDIHRTESGRDLLTRLGNHEDRLLSALVHKFWTGDAKSFEQEVARRKSEPVQVVGDLFVFVDECHRTQSGRMHKFMKTTLPDATFIGFTGTPLLKQDEKTSREVFGDYIHVYNFGEAVKDKVVLDLVYEARDIEQRLSAPEKVDEWFKLKTKELSAHQRTELQKVWATMRKVLSSEGRMERIVEDIVFDFERQPRLSNDRGTAMLVAASIYEACRFYELFQKTRLRGKCALVTSYQPEAKDVSKEDIGENTENAKEVIYRVYQDLLQGRSTMEYEDDAKRLFRHEPGEMKLLIVVDKLLTGFDAPSCTYLYIDKSMRDHGLFQAICRTNRLDGEDKNYGYIVDYKDLFKNVEDAIEVYSGELADNPDGSRPQIELKDRLKEARRRLDNALEAMSVLCEPVLRPKMMQQYIQYFCGNIDLPDEIEQQRPQRERLYQATARLVRSFASIDAEMLAAGYSEEQAREIRNKIRDYVKIRDGIQLAANEYLDPKEYEADMRALIDRFLDADTSKKISQFDDISLVELLATRGGIDTADHIESKTGAGDEAIAEVIARNVRSYIVERQLSDPAFFSKMSDALDELLLELKSQRLEYKKYLEKVAELARTLEEGRDAETPASLDTKGKRALYNNLGEDVEKTLRIHDIVVASRPDGWRETEAKRRVIKRALYKEFQDEDMVERIFAILKNQDEY